MPDGGFAQARRLAVVAGASGLVGRELLQRLLGDPRYARVVALARRSLRIRHDRLREAPAHFEALETVLSSEVPTNGVLHAFCCLGTTLRQAGSAQAFRTVDFDYVVAFSRWAMQRGARRLIVVSALGANARSPLLYSRIKGEAEAALRSLAGPALVILRPSLLDGARRERRTGESLALALARPLRALLPASVRPVRADDVAQSMIDAAFAEPALDTLESADLQGAARRADPDAAG